MLRRPALAALLLCALPSPALANPSISVSSSPVGGLRSLPATVEHRLTLTAGATQEMVAISAGGPLAVSGTGVTTGPVSALGPPAFQCASRWTHPHEPYGSATRFSTTMTLARFATAFVDTAITLRKPPWAADLLDADWEITPAQGGEFDVVSTAPSYAGPSGVELGFSLTRLSKRVYAVQGTAEPGVDSGHVALWAYPPGRKHAVRVAFARVRDSAWSIPHLRLPRNGRWDFYARYRTAGQDYANDASVCGTVVRVR